MIDPLVSLALHAPTQAVAAWGRAHPSSTRQKKVLDDLDMPVLRSNRNALGVLAGGGGTDLTDDRDDSAEVR